jgi:predicted sulfurtransferase
LRGTVYIAKEGINAQFSVSVGDALQNLLETFGEKGCLPFDTFAQNPPNLGTVVEGTVPTFDRLIVRTRDYILRDGILPQKGDDDSVLDWSDAGVELDAKDWDEQLRLGTTSDEKIQLLDCRNTYESDQGTFRSSTPLNTQTFSETWSLLDTQVESNSLDPNEPVYIFCTGGIRCVKVGAYLKQRLGFQDVRSLKHGIIGYERWANDERVLKENDCGSNEEEEDLWVGENFLFDKRRFAEGAPDSEETKE